MTPRLRRGTDRASLLRRPRARMVALTAAAGLTVATVAAAAHSQTPTPVSPRSAAAESVQLQSQSLAKGKTYTAPKIKHVWTIILENKSYESSFTGLNQNSYLWKTLPSYGNLLRQYFGTGHFSEDNYLSLVSGQGASPGPQNDCPLYNNAAPNTPTADGQYVINNGGCVFASNTQTLFNQFDKAHVSYKGYMQDMGNDPTREPATCGNPGGLEPGAGVPNNSTGATPTDQYVAKHNPFPWFHSLLDNGDCAAHVVPLAKNLAADLADPAKTPAFSWITPNNCSDAHDATCKGDNLSGGSNALTGETKPPVNSQGGLYAADLFLEQVVPAIMKSAAYQDGGLIDITFDEGFPPYTTYGNSIANKTYSGDAGLGTDSKTGQSVESEANTAQSVVACCNELTGPNTTQPGDQAFNQDTTPGGGITGSVLISPYITPGSVTDQPYNHYSWLRSMEDIFGITKGGSDGQGHLAYAGAAGLRPFGPDVYNNPKGKVVQPQISGEGGVYAAQATINEVDKPVSFAPVNGAPTGTG